jgi:hypothetical protein
VPIVDDEHPLVDDELPDVVVVVVVVVLPKYNSPSLLPLFFRPVLNTIECQCG